MKANRTNQTQTSLTPMTRREKILAAAGALIVAVAYVTIPQIADAAGGTSVYGTASNGLPAPIGAEGDKLKVSATMRAKAPDGGSVEARATAAGSQYVAPEGGSMDTKPKLKAPDGGSVEAAGSASGSQYVVPEPGSTAAQPPTWHYDSTACLNVVVDSASKDAGTLAATDGGVPQSGVLYRCTNPSGSVGDVCWIEGGIYPLTCLTPQSMMRLAPGQVELTRLVSPVRAVSSSGAAGLTCCPVVFP